MITQCKVGKRPLRITKEASVMRRGRSMHSTGLPRGGVAVLGSRAGSRCGQRSGERPTELRGSCYQRGGL